MKSKFKQLFVKKDLRRTGFTRGSLARREEAGLSSVEIVLVVLAGLILLAAAIAVYQKFETDNEMSQALSGLQQLTAGVEEEFQGQSSYTGLSDSLIIDAGMAPSSFVSGSSLQDPWGGAVKLAAASGTGAAGYDITFTDVPQSACNELGQQTMGNLLSLTIGSTAISLPITPAAVDTACASGSNTLVWNID